MRDYIVYIWFWIFCIKLEFQKKQAQQIKNEKF